MADMAQKTVKFINDEASSVHGSLKVGTIYTSESGEWKLGGLEVLSSIKDDEAIIYVCRFTIYNTIYLTKFRIMEVLSPIQAAILLPNWHDLVGTLSSAILCLQSTRTILEF